METAAVGDRQEGCLLRNKILHLCDRFEKKFVSMRRALHRIPEPSFRETRTQAKICSYLEAGKIEHSRVSRTTGVLGLIRGGGRKTVALRADMDALNITEKTGLPFASRHPGFMHACGHDAHMAMVTGAGLVLKQLGKDLPGNVRLIYQPAEETSPGGALAMIRAGALRSPRVGAVIGLHVQPTISASKVAVNPGTVSAAGDEFSVTITGKGGHGSSPHKGVDAVMVAAEFITSLQTIVSRRVNPMESVVVSVGRISGGEKCNIIAERVDLEGPIRTKTVRMRRRVPAMIKRILRSTCSSYGAEGHFECRGGYPPVVCDPGLSALVTSACSDMLGRSRTTTSPGLEMGGEDFAYYAEKVPGVMIFVGVGNPAKGKTYLLHHSKFDIDEASLRTGVAALAYSAYRYLADEKGKADDKGR
jgi:amidohydrolase